jgi:hypothetical protein
MRSWVSWVVLALTLMGCGRQIRPVLDARGYRHPLVEYQIANREDGTFLGPLWVLDNYRADGTPKDTPAYVVTFRYDRDGDGDLENLGRRPLDDLRFRSTRDAGTIWARTIPLPRSFATTELSVLLRLIVDGISSTGTVAASVDRDTVVATARTFTASVLDTRVIAVDGREGIVATIDVANLAQLQLDPSARTERVRLVLVRTDYRIPLDPREMYGGLAPGLLMLGYSNLPAEYERSLGEFEDLVARVVFDTPESSGGSVLAQCASPDGVTAFALERVGLYTHVLVRPEDDEDRACIERELDAAHLEPGRSYGFRPAPLRFSAPTSAPTSSAAPAAAVPDSATAPDPAAAAEPTPEQ